MEDFEKIILRQSLWSFQKLFTPNGESQPLSDILDFFLTDKVFQEALFWSSPELSKAFRKLEEGSEQQSPKKKQQLYQSLQRYAIRAACRPTPFGIFAGVSLQSLSNGSKDSNENQRSFRHLQPDAVLVQKLAQAIYKDAQLREHLIFYPNNTLYTVGNEFRFLEILKIQKSLPQISAFEKSEFIITVYRLAEKKGLSFDKFYKFFSHEFSRGELQSFFYELVESGFLVNELEPKLADGHPLQSIACFLDRVKDQCPDAVLRFRQVLHRLESYQTKVMKALLSEFYFQDYRDLCEFLKKAGIEPPSKSFFHVTLSQPAPEQSVLTKRDRRNLLEAVRLVRHLFPENKVDKELERFKNLFVERYETRSIPLLKALDPDIGIGFPANEHLGHKGSSFFYREEKSNTTGEPFLPENLWNRIENHGNSRAAIEFPSSIWKNTEELISFPKSFFVMGEKVGNGKILMQGIGNGPTYSLLARFSHSNSEIKNFCREIAEEEQKLFPGRILADILWTPEAKITNVLHRISPLDYEIPILYRGSKDNSHQILLEDLGISVVGNKITLFSKRLKKEILPRLSNAHHYKSDKNPIYRFLCALQHPEGRLRQPKLAFGNTQKRYLPRLIYKNIILSPAQWQLQRNDCEEIKKAMDSLEALRAFMNKWKIPAQIAWCQGDRELFLDLSKDDYADILLKEIKKEKPVLLREWLHVPEKTSHIQQFILPLKSKNIKSKKSWDAKTEEKVKRSFPPGSEWLYFKIYCASDFSDLILKQVNHQVITKLQQLNALKKWFFIRYLDPHYHIRLRFLLTDISLISEVVRLINVALSEFRENEMVWRIQLDTYERELERYSSEYIDDSETVFWKDSECFLQRIERTGILDNSQQHRLLAVLNLLNWCSLTKWNLYEQRDFCEQLFEHFKREKSLELIRGIKKQYREDKEMLFNAMENKAWREQFNSRNDSLKNLILPPQNIKSYIHMSLNRWFRSDQRDWEFMVYYYSLNYLRYRIHRKK